MRNASMSMLYMHKCLLAVDPRLYHNYDMSTHEWYYVYQRLLPSLKLIVHHHVQTFIDAAVCELV